MENNAKLIHTMKKVDQELRFKAKEAADNGDPQPNMYNYMVYLADAVHNTRIWKLIHENGFPTSNTYDKEIMKDFWLLIQHQDLDLTLQQQCLENCHFEETEHNHLEDRVLINQGKPQKHSTQYQS
ncbi:MAG TPA: hypothetical protein PLF31_00295 [Candidatus Paceibacterota bacterium]|nr:hypothetical protein [Candidatus Paceibacterota bacterium]